MKPQCFAPDTTVALYDGQIKMVKDLTLDDRLMSDDGLSIGIIGLGSGQSEMFKILPKWEKSFNTFTVSDQQIMIIKQNHMPGLQQYKVKGQIMGYAIHWNDGTGVRYKRFSYNKNGAFTHQNALDLKNIHINSYDIRNITVSDFEHMPNTWKKYAQIFHNGFDWPDYSIELDPYIYGLWLGDGTTNVPGITSDDKEIVDYLDDFCNKHGLTLHKNDIHYRLSVKNGFKLKNKNYFTKCLRDMGCFDNKHIVKSYLMNSREVRYKVLAGLIDSDGYLDNRTYEIVQKREQLSKDIVYLARSLGLSVSCQLVQKTCTNSSRGRVTGWYYRMFIGGGEELSELSKYILLPRKRITYERTTKTTPNISRIKIENLGIQDYNSFTMERDTTYLLGDFTVMHT